MPKKESIPVHIWPETLTDGSIAYNVRTSYEDISIYPVSKEAAQSAAEYLVSALKAASGGIEFHVSDHS